MKKLGEVTIDYVTAHNDKCNRACCTTYTMRVLGVDIAITADEARDIMRRMESEASFQVFGDRNGACRTSRKIVHLALVLE